MSIPIQLFRLEQLDSDLEQLQAQLAGMRRRIERNSQLEAAEARLDTLRRELRQAETQQRDLEGDLAALEAKIKRDQSRLYGGSVVDPRELASLEKELEHYRSQHSELEDRVLGIMEQVDQLQSDVTAASWETNQLRERWETDRPALEQEAEQTTDVLAGMRTEREALAAAIDKSALNLYQRLRNGSGHAVSAVSNGICQWCRVTVPAKDVQHARAGSLVTCTNCNRVLYVGS
jgi:predicted  nucleic acid-binding Zn-ribbon protein